MALLPVGLDAYRRVDVSPAAKFIVSLLAAGESRD